MSIVLRSEGIRGIPINFFDFSPNILKFAYILSDVLRKPGSQFLFFFRVLNVSYNQVRHL